MNLQRIGQRRGIALLSVMIAMALAALIAAASMYLTQSQFELLQSLTLRQQAYYAAEAGLQHALWRLRRGEAVDNPITITLNESGFPRIFTVNLTTAVAGNFTAVTATVNY